MQLSFLIISRTGKIKLRPYLLHPSENLSFLLQQQCSFLLFFIGAQDHRSTNVASIKKYKKATKVLLIVGRKLLSHSYILFFHNISTNWLAPLPSFYPFLCKMHNAWSEKRSITQHQWWWSWFSHGTFWNTLRMNVKATSSMWKHWKHVKNEVKFDDQIDKGTYFRVGKKWKL